tara:strand:+ start:19527 stop:21662 length:2136 start_codon:yes stop_codon:yes gene_type:complete
MKQIFQDLSNGDLLIEDIPAPKCSKDELLIKTTCSLISSGTERFLIQFGQDNLINKAKKNPERVKQVLDKAKTDGIITTINSVKNKLSEPLPLGYCNVGTVVEIGQNISDFKVGDRVVSNGPHAEIVAVSKNLCEKVPESVTDQEAVFTVIGSISLQGIRLAKPTFGETFLVLGLGLVGIMAAKILKANGCEVIAIDVDKSKCDFAASIGIKSFCPSSDLDSISWILKETREVGADGVLITASTPSSTPLEVAAKVTRSKGRIIQVGLTGLDLNREEFYKKELSLQVSCSYGPGRYDKNYEINGQDYPQAYVRWTLKRNFNAFLNALKNKTINTEKLISNTFKIEEANKAYDLLKSNKQILCILFTYEGFQNKLQKSLSIQKEINTKENNKSYLNNPVLGFIGSGNYARGILIPNFKKMGVKFNTICAKTGVQQIKVSRTFGFENITTDHQTLLKNKKINVVVIATRHDSHANYICESLLAGKNVFVEKPLCLNLEQLQNIKEIYLKSSKKSNGKLSPILMVGFNRRFSPLIIKAKNNISQLSQPKAIIYTINAGKLPNDHWLKDKEIGGGRLIGEACHFVDLLRHLVGYKISNIKISNLGNQDSQLDSFSLLIDFEDGSIGNVNYLANGHKSFPKEKIEIFCQEKVILINNFKKIQSWGFKRSLNESRFTQDKGQYECIKKFIDSIKKGKEPPIAFDQILEVHKWLLDLN